MIHVPSNKPHIPPSVAKEAAKEVSKPANQLDQADKTQNQKSVAPKLSNVGRGPELDSRAIAVRLAALATEAKKKEIGYEEFERILNQVIELTGLMDPEAALEEANQRLQKEIETELEKIMANKELMDEAKDWEKFAELLANMGQETAQAMIGMLNDSIKELI
ncbi:MAG: hypothetical protein ABH823_01130 [bacterium]